MTPMTITTGTSNITTTIETPAITITTIETLDIMTITKRPQGTIVTIKILTTMTITQTQDMATTTETPDVTTMIETPIVKTITQVITMTIREISEAITAIERIPEITATTKGTSEVDTTMNQNLGTEPR
jgi:hypothetical protein